MTDGKDKREEPSENMIEREPSAFVDYAKAPVATVEKPSKNRGGVGTHFPTLLHLVLTRAQKDGYSHICAWKAHGRGFAVLNRDKFVAEVMPSYFRQSQYASFQRQLNLYGFRRLSQKSSESGAYYHEKFLRTRADLCQDILRAKEKDMRALKACQQEPDFSTMPPMPPTTEDDIGTTENILMEQKTGAKEGQELHAMVVESLSTNKKTGQEDPLADWLKKVVMSGVESNDSWMDPTPIAQSPMLNSHRQFPNNKNTRGGDFPSLNQNFFALPKPGPMQLPSFLTAKIPDPSNSMDHLTGSEFSFPHPLVDPPSASGAMEHELRRKVSEENMQEKRPCSSNSSRGRCTKRQQAGEIDGLRWALERHEEFSHEEVAGMVSFLQDVDLD